MLPTQNDDAGRLPLSIYDDGDGDTYSECSEYSDDESVTTTKDPIIELLEKELSQPSRDYSPQRKYLYARALEGLRTRMEPALLNAVHVALKDKSEKSADNLSQLKACIFTEETFLVELNLCHQLIAKFNALQLSYDYELPSEEEKKVLQRNHYIREAAFALTKFTYKIEKHLHRGDIDLPHAIFVLTKMQDVMGEESEKLAEWNTNPANCHDALATWLDKIKQYIADQITNKKYEQERLAQQAREANHENEDAYSYYSDSENKEEVEQEFFDAEDPLVPVLERLLSSPFISFEKQYLFTQALAQLRINANQEALIKAVESAQENSDLASLRNCIYTNATYTAELNLFRTAVANFKALQNSPMLSRRSGEGNITLEERNAFILKTCEAMDKFATQLDALKAKNEIGTHLAIRILVKYQDIIKKASEGRLSADLDDDFKSLADELKSKPSRKCKVLGGLMLALVPGLVVAAALIFGTALPVVASVILAGFTGKAGFNFFKHGQLRPRTIPNTLANSTESLVNVSQCQAKLQRAQ